MELGRECVEPPAMRMVQERLLYIRISLGRDELFFPSIL
jgi:hypothetical protein